MIEIPGYRIVRPLGRGGMASVHLAIQESVDREVALKIMSPALLADPNFGERFLREARIAAKLRHRHVVGVHDVGKVGDLHYIAMEYLTGGPILHKDGRPRDVAFALRVTREIATALGYAHAKGFIHRDVKPDNVFLVQDRERVVVKLLDFGLCRGTFDGVRTLTREGSVVGTPGYLAPEQVSAAGSEVDTRADLFTAGLVLFEMLAGRPVYRGKNVVQLIAGLMTFEVPAIRVVEPSVPPCLERVLIRATERDPDERYQTAACFLHELLEARTKIRLVRQRASC